ncbi:MAG: AarF/ABC1/UbiB kinase family protein [Oscillospiraceae bacterium]|nr:AarF/ABC1/UbiB kinase family protein [Oscillospiraceae bacterium]
MHQVLDVGIFHGDLHQGNLMISHGIPYWIDFGMIGHLSEQNIGMIQEIVLSLLQKNTEQLVNIILSMGVTNGTVDTAKLIEDADVLVDRYMSMKDLSRIDMGQIMTDMTGIMTAHHIKMPSEFTMLARSLVTIEGVLEAFCPDLNLFDFLTRKMTERIRETINIRSKVKDLLRDAASVGMEAAQVPGAVFTLLKNLSKGRMKLNIELTGYERLLDELETIVKYVVLAIFSCVLFSGSCVLCTTNIEPKMNGIPFVALVGFVVSVALAIYTIIRMVRRR